MLLCHDSCFKLCWSEIGKPNAVTVAYILDNSKIARKKNTLARSDHDKNLSNASVQKLIVKAPFTS